MGGAEKSSWQSIKALNNLTIRHGGHKPPNGEAQTCAMEAAYLRWAVRQKWPKQKIIEGFTDKLDWDAAWDAARDAAKRRLAPTVADMQDSAKALLVRMCKLKKA